MKLHHIGYLVSNLKESIKVMALLESDIIISSFVDTKRQAYFALLQQETTLVELIQPMQESKLQTLKKRVGNAPYHLCFSCKDIDSQFKILRKQGFFPMEEISESALFEGKRVCFLFNKTIGIIELIEE